MYGSQPTNTIYNVQQILLAAFQFTGAARGYLINFLCGPWVQKIGQHWATDMSKMCNKGRNS